MVPVIAFAEQMITVTDYASLAQKQKKSCIVTVARKIKLPTSYWVANLEIYRQGLHKNDFF